MAHNTIVVEAPPETVFAVLSDGFAYQDWIVGSERVLAVDPGFPAPGTRFQHRSGTGPVKVRDHTEVVDAHPPYRLDLVARARPLFGSARVALLVAPRGRSGSHVTMIEHAADRPSRLLLNPLSAPLVHVRNARSLRRLRWLAEARATGADGGR